MNKKCIDFNWIIIVIIIIIIIIISWFRIYLTNRQSRVSVSGTLSLPFQVTSGVPQGSLLGALSFQRFHKWSMRIY
jgi:hypothetical protein